MVHAAVRCGASALADFYNASRATLYFLGAGHHSPAPVEPQRRGEGAAVRPLLSYRERRPRRAKFFDSERYIVRCLISSNLRG